MIFWIVTFSLDTGLSALGHEFCQSTLSAQWSTQPLETVDPGRQCRSPGWGVREGREGVSVGDVQSTSHTGYCICNSFVLKPTFPRHFCHSDLCVRSKMGAAEGGQGLVVSSRPGFSSTFLDSLLSLLINFFKKVVKYISHSPRLPPKKKAKRK